MPTLVSLVFYLSFFFLSTVLLYIGEKRNLTWAKVSSLVILILVAAFRYNTGIDYANYVGISDALSPISVSQFLASGASSIYEHSLFYIIKIANIFYAPHVLLFGIYAIITIIPFYLGFKKLVPSKTWLGMLLFMLMFFAPSLNGMRQYAAIAIVFFAVASYLKDQLSWGQKIIHFIVLVLVASFIHSSAICCLLLIPVEFVSRKFLAKRPSSTAIIIYCLMMTLVAVGLEFVAVLNINAIPFLNKYAHYLTWSLENAPMPNLIPKLFPIGVATLTLFRIKNHDENIFYYVLTFVTFVLSLVGLFIPYGYRLSDYFAVFQMPLLINIASASDDKNRKQLYMLLLIAYGLVYFIYSAALNNSHGIFPYQLL